MPNRSSKPRRSRDTNILAKSIVDEVTADTHDEEPVPEASSAQDTPGGPEISESTDDTMFCEEMVRSVVREELDSFATQVLKTPATMGNSQSTLDPIVQKAFSSSPSISARYSEVGTMHSAPRFR